MLRSSRTDSSISCAFGDIPVDPATSEIAAIIGDHGAAFVLYPVPVAVAMLDAQQEDIVIVSLLVNTDEMLAPLLPIVGVQQLADQVVVIEERACAIARDPGGSSARHG